MKITVIIESETAADVGGVVRSLADYFDNTKPSPWANVPPYAPVPKAVDFPTSTGVGETSSPPSAGRTWEVRTPKPHPPRGED